MFNTGTPGVLRFFQAPLAKEMSWLLPFGLVVLLLSAVSGFIGLGRLRRFRLPLLSDEHKALVLWGGWLATCLVFFSIAGFFHNYYLGTVAPALAAVVGMGFFTLLKLARLNRWIAAAALLAAAGVTLAFQLYLVGQFGLRGAWSDLALGLLGLAAVIALVALLLKSKTEIFFRMATVVTLAAMMVIPAIWSARTVAANASSNLPEAYTGDGANSVRSFGGFGGGAGGFNAGSGAASSLVSFLEANTKNIKYLVAVPSSQTGSNLVLETGRAVLFMGGFTGSDPVVDAASLAKLVASGELRYILYGGMGGGPGGSGGSSNVGSWIQSNCSQVTAVSTTGSGMRGGLDGGTLYQCGG
jgi:4-amino-4-deoxy-L-arabinose transferase-like glycosyltransferase